MIERISSCGDVIVAAEVMADSHKCGFTEVDVEGGDGGDAAGEAIKC